jgi:DNA helicase HerA-like ATPase
MTDSEAGKLFIGAGAKPAHLTLRLANRHGLIAGATGTGKTVTLRSWRKASPPPASSSSPA